MALADDLLIQATYYGEKDPRRSGLGCGYLFPARHCANGQSAEAPEGRGALENEYRPMPAEESKEGGSPRAPALLGISGLVAGLFSGSAFWIFGSSFSNLVLGEELIFGGLIGLGFGLALGRAILTTGSGLMWGVAYGLLWWITRTLTLGPLLSGAGVDWTVDAVRQIFPHLVGYLVCYGAVLGLGTWFCSGLLAGGWQLMRVRALISEFLSALIIGGMAGFVGGLAFGAWMERVGVYPLVAGLVKSDSHEVGQMVHFVISVIIGASYGALFRRDIRGTGSGIAWGLSYGMIWWVLGPLTIMPWWLGQGIQWSLASGQSAFPSLVGHVIYGILLGVVYSLVDRLWRLLFTESDPLKRELEGPGTRSLRAMGMGILASVAGGLAFTFVMVKTNALPAVASLVGMTSPAAGFVVHMVISAIIGATYGLLFRREAYTCGAGLAWGLVYGLAWWFLGPLTLMPILLGAEVQWSLAAATGAYPSLIGHLAYGGITALTYWLLVIRYDPSVRSQVQRARTRRGRTPGTPAPALWAVVLILGVMLPLVFSGSGLQALPQATTDPYNTPSRPNP